MKSSFPHISPNQLRHLDMRCRRGTVFHVGVRNQFVTNTNSLKSDIYVNLCGSNMSCDFFNVFSVRSPNVWEIDDGLCIIL